MIAALPMYDRPENRAAHDAFYAAFREALGYGPDALDRTTAYDATWAHPDLLLGQICNLPYRAKFIDKVTRVANVDFGLPDTPAGYYHSVFVVRAERAALGLAPAALGTFAYNDALSQSGWGAPHATLANKGLQVHSTLRTGAHVDSMRAVADGRADLAAIDAVTWKMLQAYEPATADLSVVGRTILSPGMTFITAKGNDPAPIRAALNAAYEATSAENAAAIHMHGLLTLPDAAYDLPLPPAP